MPDRLHGNGAVDVRLGVVWDCVLGSEAVRDDGRADLSGPGFGPVDRKGVEDADAASIGEVGSRLLIARSRRSRGIEQECTPVAEEQRSFFAGPGGEAMERWSSVFIGVVAGEVGLAERGGGEVVVAVPDVRSG